MGVFPFKAECGLCQLRLCLSCFILGESYSRTPHGYVDDNADMEMYKGDSKFRITRITAFQSVCPICSAQIQIDYGKPDLKELLVGRCRESPLAHVYSFDRDTLKGFFLGHEGYLK